MCVHVVRVCVCVRACVCVHVYAWLYVRMSKRVCVYVFVFPGSDDRVGREGCGLIYVHACVFNTLFCEVLDGHAPLKTVRVKKNPAPWIIKPIRDEMDRRNMLFMQIY